MTIILISFLFKFVGTCSCLIIGINLIFKYYNYLKTPAKDYFNRTKGKEFFVNWIGFIIFFILLVVGLYMEESGGYLSQKYDRTKYYIRDELTKECSSEATSYCQYKWFVYRKDSTKIANKMKNYFEKHKD